MSKSGLLNSKESVRHALQITSSCIDGCVLRVVRAGAGEAPPTSNRFFVFLQWPEVETLGITIVSGDMWRDEEVAHTLRLLEIVGRADIPVVPGAIFPLIDREEMILRWEAIYGKVSYKGAWNRKATGDGVRGFYHGPYEVPKLVEGNPTTKPSDEGAAHFIIRWSTSTRMK